MGSARPPRWSWFYFGLLLVVQLWAAHVFAFFRMNTLILLQHGSWFKPNPFATEGVEIVKGADAVILGVPQSCGSYHVTRPVT